MCACVCVWKTKRNIIIIIIGQAVIFFTRARCRQNDFIFFPLCAFFTRLLLTRASSILHICIDAIYITERGKWHLYAHYHRDFPQSWISSPSRIVYNNIMLYVQVVLYHTIVAATEQMCCTLHTWSAARFEGIFIFSSRGGGGGKTYHRHS